MRSAGRQIDRVADWKIGRVAEGDNGELQRDNGGETAEPPSSASGHAGELAACRVDRQLAQPRPLPRPRATHYVTPVSNSRPCKHGGPSLWLAHRDLRVGSGTNAGRRHEGAGEETRCCTGEKD